MASVVGSAAAQISARLRLACPTQHNDPVSDNRKRCLSRKKIQAMSIRRMTMNKQNNDNNNNNNNNSQLISGVSYCHSMEICHHDLKLENTLLDGSPTPCPKKRDFGCSKSALLHSQPRATVGTPAYIAPEVLSRKEYDGKYYIPDYV